MHAHSLFEDLLALQPPYHIARINQEHDEKGLCAVHVYIELEEGYRPIDANGQGTTIHDYQARIWKHLNLSAFICGCTYSARSAVTGLANAALTDW